MPQDQANGGPAEHARLKSATAEASRCVTEAERRLADAVQTLLSAVHGGQAHEKHLSAVARDMRKLNRCLSDLSQALGLSVADELEPPDNTTN